MHPPDSDSPEEIPVIRPDLVRPAGGTPAPVRGIGAAPGPARGSRFLITGALAILLVLGVGVFFALPEMVAERAPVTAPPPTEVDPPASPRVPARDAADVRRDAEAVLGQVLRAKAVLEADGVELWAGPEHGGALVTLAAGDVHFAAGEFAAAGAQYRDVLGVLEALDRARPERLADALVAGEAALVAADGVRAAAAFAAALALEPEHEAAAIGAQRAVTIEAVSALEQEALAYEAAGELDAAQGAFDAALALDVHAGAAREGAQRVREALAERAFAVALSQALEALDAGRLTDAGRALQMAATIRPGAPALADARARLAAASALGRIRAHRQQAETLERDEQWREAVAVYDKALAVDAGLAFAVAGRARSEAMARLHDTVDALLAAPERLSAEAPLAQAREILADAGELPERGPVLTGKLAALERQVSAATQPVGLQLRSDGLTQVAVQRVGRLGTFESRTVRLRPGRYVVTGSRAGYRDVRREVHVRPGQVPAPVDVRCVEPVT